ncbi:MAG: energy transducer TonB [Myxococcaceae bacterium]
MTPNPGWRRRRRPVPPVLLAFVGTLAVHILFFGAVAVLAWLGWLFPERTPSDGQDVQVALRPISDAEWARNRGAPLSSSSSQNDASEPAEDSQQLAQNQKKVPEQKKPEPKKEKPEEAPGKHVVTAPGNDEESPDAKYAAETSNRVEKETVAKDRSPVFRNPMPKRTTTAPNQGSGMDDVQQAQRDGNQGMGNDDRPMRDATEKKFALEVPDMKGRDALQVESSEGEGPGPQVSNRRESAEVKGNSNRLRLQDGIPGSAEDASQGKAGRPGVLTLTPSMAVLGVLEGSAASDLRTGEVEEGEGTYLNTREWKYASFFTRVKQGVGMTWNPMGELRQRDPSLKMYGSRDRYTLLEVTLAEDGRVKNVAVVKSSGLDFLDLEAMQSFYRAQPFPNLPAGMRGPDGTAQFQFGFYLEFGTSPFMRIFGG